MNNPRFAPYICLTHNCNLNCIYCYQKHDSHSRMTYETSVKVIDWIFANVPTFTNGIEISFIGGEPLLEFELIKKIVAYVSSKKTNQKYIFYATTNGTLLTTEMKSWFVANKEIFYLGLSIDGTPATHNHNRSNSYDKIDINFFKTTWPNQGVKMTLSEYSLYHLAENIEYIHSLGFKEIGGVNLFEGTFDWSDEKYIALLIPQLKELVDFYVEHDDLEINQMLNKRIDICEIKNRNRKKWCGIGDGTNFFDIDGKMYPCPFVTPMTFDSKDMDDILCTDFTRANNFIDDDCFNNCYIYPICPFCAGANYLNSKTFKIRDKSKCRINKLIVLFAADLQMKRIIKNDARYDKSILNNTINSIIKIKTLLLPEFSQYFE